MQLAHCSLLILVEVKSYTFTRLIIKRTRVTCHSIKFQLSFQGSIKSSVFILIKFQLSFQGSIKSSVFI